SVPPPVGFADCTMGGGVGDGTRDAVGAAATGVAVWVGPATFGGTFVDVAVAIGDDVGTGVGDAAGAVGVDAEGSVGVARGCAVSVGLAGAAVGAGDEAANVAAGPVTATGTDAVGEAVGCAGCALAHPNKATRSAATLTRRNATTATLIRSNLRR